MPESGVEAEFSEEELEVLDEVLLATASSVRPDRTVAMKLQTEAGRSLCRTVLGLRDGQKVAHSTEVLAVRDGPKVLREWPSGRWGKETGEALLREFERSGLTEAAFCRATGLSRGRIRNWMRRLRPASGAAPSRYGRQGGS